MKFDVDVLAVLDGDIEGMESALSSARGRQRDDLIACIEQMRETRAAISELIEAARDSVSSGCPCDTCETLRIAIRGCGGAA